MKPGCWNYVSGRLRPRFTLRGMLVFVAILAVGLALMDRSQPDWWELPWNMLTIWVAIGLLGEAHHLWTTFRGRVNLSADERWTWQWAVAWRVAAAGLFAGGQLVNYLLTHELIVLPNDDMFFFATGEESRAALRWLLLVCVLFSRVAPRPATPQNPIWSLVVSVLMALAATVWALRVWADETLVHWFVYVSITSIERLQPFAMARPDLDINAVSRAMVFLHWSKWAALAAVWNVLCVLGLSRLRPNSLIRQTLLWVGLALGLASTLAYFTWVVDRGLIELCPAFGEEPEMAPVETWMSAFVLLVVFVSAATNRLLTRVATEPMVQPRALHWRRVSPPSQVGLALPITLTILCAITVVDEVASLHSFGARLYSNLHLLAETLTYLSFYLPAAAFLLSLWTTWIAWRHPVRMRNMTLTVISPRRFAAIWLALFATIVTAAPALTGFTFSLWLTPWWRLPLPE